jgi:uncharacterized protein YbjQ (UPF0145 family)/F0F1-type ATP synthase membrane subunit c/vacuolar-type H+-ATPase subunit K
MPPIAKPGWGKAMKKLFAAAVAAIVLGGASVAHAEDAVTNHSIAAVMERPEYAQQLEGIRFVFGRGGGRVIDGDSKVSLRTRKFGRSSEEACQWVLLSTLLQLKNRAQAVGGNAVVNIRSNWQNVEFSSTTEYQCAAGFLMAGVALKADIVRQ